MTVNNFDPSELLNLVISPLPLSPLLNLLGLQVKQDILLTITDAQVSFASRQAFNEVAGVHL